MILSISGYNWSGSGAVMDLLNEYEECKVIRSMGDPPAAQRRL